MPTYRKNIVRREIINRFGQTVGLPLFEGDDSNRRLPDKTRARLENAPKAVALATHTKKLAHLVLEYDKIALAKKQQAVLDTLIAHESLTNEEIANLLSWPINRVVGRTFELRHLGIAGKPFVLPVMKRECSITGRVVQAWKFNPDLPTRGTVEEIESEETEVSSSR